MTVYILGSDNNQKDDNYLFHFKQAEGAIKRMDLKAFNAADEWGKYTKRLSYEPTLSDKNQWKRDNIKRCDYIYYLDNVEIDGTVEMLKRYANSLNKPILKIRILSPYWGD